MRKSNQLISFIHDNRKLATQSLWVRTAYTSALEQSLNNIRVGDTGENLGNQTLNENEEPGLAKYVRIE